MTTNLELLLEERAEYFDIQWLSSTGVYTRIVEMSDEYLLNVLSKVWQKSVKARELTYVKEFQCWNNVTYNAWVRYFYNEYLYRKHEDIVVEKNIAPQNCFTEQAQDFIQINYPENNNGVYKIS